MVWHLCAAGMPLFLSSQRNVSLIGSGSMMKYDALLQKLNPDADSLVAAISKHVDDKMLLSIANADYGRNVEKYFEALRQIRDEQKVFAPMERQPGKVLSLTRWIIPSDDKYIDTLDSAHKQHIVRAFGCAVLLRAAADPTNDTYLHGDNVTIAGLLDSLLALEPPIQREALRFFTWRVQNLPQNDSENPFYVLALLVLVLRTRANLTRIELKHLIDRVFAEVRIAYRDNFFWHRRAISDQWLTWLTLFNQHHDLWQKIGLEIATLADQYGNSEGRQNLKALARHLEAIKP
jgi:hypothetical protein